MINGMDRKGLYDMLKETAKELREEAERIEHRRQVEEAKKKAEEEARKKAEEDAKKLAEEDAKKKAEEEVKEGDAANNENVVAENQQNEPMIEHVVFKDEFNDPVTGTSPIVKEPEALSKNHSLET